MKEDLSTEDRELIEEHLAASGTTEERQRSLFDIANAKRFAEQHRERLRFCEALGGWFIWDGKHWAAESNDQVMKFAFATADSRLAEIAGASTIGQKEAAFKAYAYVNRRRALRAMIDLARHQLAESTDAFDRDPFAFNCLNGTVDLRSGKVRPHDPADLITKLIGLDYDPKAPALRWQKFLAEILPDPTLRTYAQRGIGYSLTADQRAECLFVAVGGGANGKGVFFDMIRSAIGAYGSAGRPELLIRKRFESANNEDLASLRGQRLVEVSETGEAHELNEEQVKNLTGQDAIRATYKYESMKNNEFRPTHHVWLRTNNKPIIRGGTDYAIWRRLKIIPFVVTFYPEARYRAIIADDPKRGQDATLRIRDDGLRDCLREELQGILAWVVKGAVRWWNAGNPDLCEPKIVSNAVEDYRSEMDRLGQFIDECCERAAHETTPLKVIYAEYKTWALAKGWKPWGDNSLSRHLGKAGFNMSRNQTGSQCEGLKLKPTASDNTHVFFTSLIDKTERHASTAGNKSRKPKYGK